MSLRIVLLLFLSHYAQFTGGVRVTDSDGDDTTRNEDLVKMVSSEPADNSDRVTCLRQDNLDLMLGVGGKSAENLIIRQAFGGANTGLDVFVTAEKILISNLQAVLMIYRTGTTSLGFTFQGDATEKGGKAEGLGSADLWISGLEVQSLSSWVNLAKASAADQDLLKKGQNGSLQFKLSGAAQAVWMEEYGRWDVSLQDTKVDFFKFDFQGQWILEKGLNNFGGIDQVVLSGLFGALKAIVPQSYVASLNFLPTVPGVPAEQQDLFTRAEIKLSGSMNEPNGQLILDSYVVAKVALTPAVLLQVITKNFNIHELAETQVDKFLDDRKNQRDFVTNRRFLIKSLEQYGFLVNPKLLESIQEVNAMSDLRPILVNAAKGVADAMLNAIQPFIDNYNQGGSTAVDGLTSKFEGEVGWSNNYMDGQGWARLRPSLSDSGSSWGVSYSAHASLADTQVASTQEQFVKMFSLPRGMLETVGFWDKIQAPADGKATTLDLSDFALEPSNVTVKKVEMEGLLAKMMDADGNLKELWEVMHAELGKAVLQVPEVLKQSMRVFCKRSRVDIYPSGSMDIAVDSQGLNVQQVGATNEIVGSDTLREADETAFDGRLPLKFRRPLYKVTPKTLLNLAPSAGGGVFVDVQGKKDRLEFEVRAKVNVNVEASMILKQALVDRSSVDYGYVFFAGAFERSGKTEGEVESVLAVVSCGYLRIFQLPLPDNPKSMLDFSDENQQIDLTEFDGEFGPNGQCIHIRTSKKGFWRSSVTKVSLCQSHGYSARKLFDAIQLQVTRLNTPLSKANNYGTHKAYDPDFTLPKMTATTDLYKILTNPRAYIEPAGATSEWGEALETHPLSDLPEASLLEKSGGNVSKSIDAKGSLLEHSESDGGVSMDAKTCRAQEDLNRKYFPPEKFGDAAIRMVVPATPIGDIHVKLDHIHLRHFQFKVHLRRNTDTTFSFEVTGVNGEKDGNLKAFIRGLDFTIPGSSLDGFAKGWSAVESTFIKIGSLGMAKDAGHIDRGPLNVKLWMKGEFEFTKDGNWMLRDGAQSTADVSFGSGGILQAIINSLIDKYGGMDQLLVEQLWPILSMAIPAKLGNAFTSASVENGQIRHDLILTGTCRQDSKGECGPMFDLEVTDVTNVNAVPEPILHEFSTKWADQSALWSSMPMFQALADAYSAGQKVLTDGKMGGAMALRYLRDVSLGGLDKPFFGQPDWTEAFKERGEPISIGFKGLSWLPWNFFSVVFESTPGMKELLAMIPSADKKLEASGKAEFDGRDDKDLVTVSKMGLENLRLPFVATTGQAEALEVSCWIENVEARRVSVNTTDFPNVKVSADFGLGLQRDRGIQAAFPYSASENPLISISEEFKTELEKGLISGDGLVRENPEEWGDGKLPRKFRRKFATEPAKKFILKSFLESLDLEGNWTITGSEQASSKGWAIESGPPKGLEVFNMKAQFSMRTSIEFHSGFWRQLMAGGEPDTGFVHFSMTGLYGLLDKGDAMVKADPRRFAMLDIGCGQLSIYELDKKPYSKKEYSVELSEASATLKAFARNEQRRPDLRRIQSRVGYLECFKAKDGGRGLFGRDPDEYFCGEVATMQELRQALALQFARFQNTHAPFQQAAELDAPCDQPGGFGCTMPQQPEMPTRTWYRRNSLYDPSSWYPNLPLPLGPSDIQSPQDRWNDAEAVKNRLGSR
eukprot:TRINITY_DN2887_c2_g1_i6.p1 TRINITY_DN2887_c2_g1~~TRINITY_DN2887_c2_g1_i6.p1  ORF type:complete len:1700 (-),score=303.37 TRINITY_DN2887_c2_g1_i6:238-5280(-)